MRGPISLSRNSSLKVRTDRHGGGDLLVSRPLLQRFVGVAARAVVSALALVAALGQEAAEGAAPVEHVADLRGVGAGVVVRRQVGIFLELGVADRNPHGVAELLEVFQRKLFHLMGGVAALEVRAQRVALDGLGQDHRRLTLVVDGGPVGGVDLAVVVAAALEVPDLGVGHVLDQRLGARVAAEEVVAHVRAVVGLVRLVIAVGGGVHQVHQRAVAVGVQQGVPLAAPDHLDDVPAGAAEEGLQLLDDLAVAAHRAVEALQVAVDRRRSGCPGLPARRRAPARGSPARPSRRRPRSPHVLVGGVLDAAVVQVVVEPGLVDGVQRAQAHRHRREFPEVGHQPRVRIGRQPAAGVAVFLAEAVEAVGGQPAFQEGARVNSRATRGPG